jgi:hypothetical protein
MSSTNHRKSRLKSAVIIAAVAYIGVQLVLAAIRFFHERRVQGEARQWFAQAEEDAKPTWTEDDAILWLHDHGVPKAYRGEQSGSSGHYYLVQGWRRIEEEGMVFGPTSVRMDFLFDLDHRFRRAEYEVWPFKEP